VRIPFFGRPGSGIRVECVFVRSPFFHWIMKRTSVRSLHLSRRSGYRLVLCLVSALSIASCKTATDPGSTNNNVPIVGVTSGLPADFPTIVSPADNPWTAEKSALGRKLFYSKLLSSTMTKACADCHHQANAFSDFGHSTSLGVAVFNGRDTEAAIGKRNAPGLANVAYNFSYFWDGRSSNLEQQALMPIKNPIEMNNTLPVVVSRLSKDTSFQKLFTAAFGDAKIDSVRIGQAMACFERTMVSGNSPFDKYKAGDHSALSCAPPRPARRP